MKIQDNFKHEFQIHIQVSVKIGVSVSYPSWCWLPSEEHCKVPSFSSLNNYLQIDNQGKAIPLRKSGALIVYSWATEPWGQLNIDLFYVETWSDATQNFETMNDSAVALQQDPATHNYQDKGLLDCILQFHDSQNMMPSLHSHQVLLC